MSSFYKLPSKFDYYRYYSDQAAGAGPPFPVFKARQKGGFIAPFVRRHGVPFLKWLGKQAATFATGVGKTYIDKGKVTKEDMKDMLKSQGKNIASSVLDKIKQQVGAGSMTHRRDARLSALVPQTTIPAQSGLLTNHYKIRGPNLKALMPPTYDSDLKLKSSKG